MMNAPENYSIGLLLTAFQSALRALAPIAESAGVRWREPDNYDEWDAIARGAYEGFVLCGIRASAQWDSHSELLQYDVRVDNYKQHSYVAVTWQGNAYALVCFETSSDPSDPSDPFDTCLLAELDENAQVAGFAHAPKDQCAFLVAARTSTNLVFWKSMST